MDEDQIVETVLDLVKDDIPLKVWERFFKDCEAYTKGATIPEISGNVSGGEYISDKTTMLIYGLLEGEEFELPLDQIDNFLRFLRESKLMCKQAIRSQWGPFRKRLKFTKNGFKAPLLLSKNILTKGIPHHKNVITFQLHEPPRRLTLPNIPNHFTGACP